MENMNCYECILKHIATALSYGKEILSGHGKGSDLDHRIDFLGQIVNLEHHLQLTDINTFYEVKNFRQQLQNRKIELNSSDLDYLRELYLKMENQQDNNIEQKEDKFIEFFPPVLFMNITNKSYFDICYKKLKQNLTEYDKIYYLNSKIDLSEYDIEKINYEDIESPYIYIMQEDVILLKQISARNFYRIADVESNFSYKDMVMKIKKNQSYYFYENYPCLVEKDKFGECYLKEEYPLTFYCNKYKCNYEYKAFQLCVKLDKKICCSNKFKMQTATYCKVINYQALNSVKDYLKI